MQNSEPIICKPTSWFTLRAGAMLIMFSIFCVWFYLDGTSGYQKKNLAYYTHAAFQKAAQDFKTKNNEGQLTAELWKQFAAKQNIELPSDTALLPAGTQSTIPWPEILSDFEKMKSGQPHLLWQEYSEEKRMSDKVEKKPFDAGKIREQIIVFYICLMLVVVTLFFSFRTLLRSIRADSSALTAVNGKVIPYADMKTLDLRKWDTKGIALVHFDGASGKGCAKIDGLTYGGFNAEKGEPAERLMGLVRSNFSGEIIEYTSVEPETEPLQAPEDAQKQDPQNLS